jgi:hypothetical protein
MDGLEKNADGLIEKLTNFIHLISILQGIKEKTLHPALKVLEIYLSQEICCQWQS